MANLLRLISGGEQLMLDACDGKRTIAGATDIFSYIDPDLKNWGTDVEDEATPATAVAVHEMVKDGNLAEIFTSLSGDVRKLALTQDQILNFVKKHRNWLRQDGWATLFLFRAGGKLFVAYVFVDSGGGLLVYVLRFEFGLVWRAGVRRRLVVPQL